MNGKINRRRVAHETIGAKEEFREATAIARTEVN
jgi:hypothetical protein